MGYKVNTATSTDAGGYLAWPDPPLMRQVVMEHLNNISMGFHTIRIWMQVLVQIFPDMVVFGHKESIE